MTEPSHRGILHALSTWVVAISMTVGRGRAARAVLDLAGVAYGDTVVDVGCGPGTAVREACRLGCSTIGVDPSPQMLRLARRITAVQRIRRATFVEASAESLPLPADHVAFYWSIATVHHWSNRAQALAEAHRAVAPGGRLILAERLVRPGARGHGRHGLTSDALVHLAQDIELEGFGDVGTEVVQVGRTTWIVVVAKTPPEDDPDLL